MSAMRTLEELLNESRSADGTEDAPVSFIHAPKFTAHFNMIQLDSIPAIEPTQAERLLSFLPANRLPPQKS